MTWYTKISNDISALPEFIQYHESELDSAKKEVKIHGIVEKNIASLPGITERYFSNLQEIEAVLNYLNIQLRKVRRQHFQKYLESYNRALTSRDAEKYVDGEEEVINFELLINEIGLVRNKYLGIMKGLESKNFMLGHLVRLKIAGMEDYSM